MFVSFMSFIPLSLLTRSAVFLRHLDVLGVTAEPFFSSVCFSLLLGKIEVKILTRKNAEEAGDQWLTEEDTKSFRELLINLLVTEVVLLLGSFECF